jgi:hypothetical protein
MKKFIASALALAATCCAMADLRERQIQIDIKVMSITTDNLRDIGFDWGFGIGATMEFGSYSVRGLKPFVRAEYTRSEGDFDSKIESYGLLGGVHIPIGPSKDDISKIDIVAGLGLFETKFSDGPFEDKKTKIGYDFGIRYTGIKDLPLSFLWTNRSLEGDDVNSFVIMISPTIFKSKD